jgi:hypothetical protein
MTGAARSRSTPSTIGRATPLEGDARTHAVDLVDVHEAVLEDGLRDAARALGDGIERQHLRLHVRGESRIGRRADVHGAGPPPFHVELDPVIAGA